MFPVVHYIKGIIKNFLNPHISVFSIVSADCVIHPKATIFRMCKLKHAEMGAYSYCGNNTDMENAKIGSFTSVSDNCRIGLGSHTIDCVSTCPVFTQVINGTQTSWIEKDCHAAQDKDAIVGNDVWIGSRVLVAGGVTIGDGAVVASGAVVVKDVPPYAIVGGVPAKLIRYRFSDEIIAKLLELKWWTLPESVLKDNIEFFQKEHFTVDDIDNFIKCSRTI